ncbi:hypothetical protein [Simonsiella muelleri]|uniref:hypothetical protein n=1 Tax=Simonsiella muelleri TaxID=72 RepID=UPI0023EFACA3|nr:hypothetical protein [Simonsiella muelleri]
MRFCKGFSLNDLDETAWLLAAKNLGLKAKVVKQPLARLAYAKLSNMGKFHSR